VNTIEYIQTTSYQLNDKGTYVEYYIQQNVTGKIKRIQFVMK